MTWIDWYNSLVKPSWTPSPSTISLIWMILYPIILISFGFVFVQAFRGKIEGWDGPRPERHHDFIDVKDFPNCWHGLGLTVEVEAKAKEVAVLKLKKELERRRTPKKIRNKA